ncbi:hypothetical protein PIB30_081406 [Stylosanthes scabra]|uniref:Putative plant transposon protein domain-containing protein n=1 Tax=Stylosanthes scabra TaxID=79078 RepID=A0ABU6TTX4_9FABA|nr:hypothetical protein [Stylosanthes scabra]
MASSSSVSVFDNYRFKTAFNEELYNTFVKNKKVIAECCFDLDDDEYPEIQEEMEEHEGHTYKSFVRGVPIDFSPENIRNVMQFRAQVEGATTDFETRKEHDQQLDRVLADLCMPGATWKLSTGQQRVPIQSEIPVIRVILIHCIMNGEDVRAEDIIADKMVRMAQRIKEKGKLGFPSTIYKLCKEVGVPIREFRRTKKIPVEKPITVKRMESTRLPRHLQYQQQDNEDEDQPMPQAGEGNEEGQGYEHDYHHQPEFDHQPEYDHQHDFQEEPQQALEKINKSQAEYMAELRSIKGKQQEMYDNNDRFYNQVREEQREMAKEIQQVKNYQVNQTMVESARNKALMDELAAVRSKQEEFFSNHANQYNMIRQEQKLLGKEILDVKKYQMSTVTMGSSSSPQKYEPDQTLMNIREQHANFSEMQRQLKEWRRNSSARECYSVWAHQQANPNLVEMPVHKVTKQIYDNKDNNRPMFYGFLKSDLQPLETVPPPPKSNDPHNAPN